MHVDKAGRKNFPGAIDSLARFGFA